MSRSDLEVIGARQQPKASQVAPETKPKTNAMILADAEALMQQENPGAALELTDRILHATPQSVGAAANGLYDHGFFESDRAYLTLCCVGATRSHEISRAFPNVPQITWPRVAEFIHRRFSRYRDAKLSHPQWDQDGQTLWDWFEGTDSPERFRRLITSNLDSRQNVRDASAPFGAHRSGR